MRVVVLGGTGFLGPDVVRELVARGAEVTVVHSGAHEADLPAGVTHLHVDRAHLAGVASPVRAFGPRAILDMAPMIEAHAEATMALARGVARRVVAISSSDVYRAYGRIHGTEPGPPEPLPISEEAPLRERLYPYRGGGGDPWAEDYDKIPIERRVLGDDAVEGTVLRLALVHGPRFYRYYEYARRMLDERPAIPIAAGVASWHATRAYAEDVALAIAVAVLDDRASGRVYNVGEPDGLREAEVLRALGEAAAWDGEIVHVVEKRVPPALRERLPKWAWETWRDPQDFVLDTRRIRAELGYRERVPRSQGLRRTIDWMREHPPTEEHPVIRGGVDYAAEDELLAAMR